MGKYEQCFFFPRKKKFSPRKFSRFCPRKFASAREKILKTAREKKIVPEKKTGKFHPRKIKTFPRKNAKLCPRKNPFENIWYEFFSFYLWDCGGLKIWLFFLDLFNAFFKSTIAIFA